MHFQHHLQKLVRGEHMDFTMSIARFQRVNVNELYSFMVIGNPCYLHLNFYLFNIFSGK